MEERYLPEDLMITEIFPRLPAKNIHRLGSVSRRFRYLTSHPSFLDAFRRHCSGRYVLSFKTAFEKRTVFYYSDPQLQSKIADGRKKEYMYIKFINGFVCLVEAARRRINIVIRNPATEQQFRLPELPFDLHHPHRKIFFFFCYDPRSDRHKVLTTNVVRSQNLEMGYSVFSIGDDERWRSFMEEDPHLIQLGNSRSVCINGVLFCTNFSNIEGYVIAAFDVGSERFSCVEYPKELPSSSYQSCHVIEVGGLIGIVDSEDILSCGIVRLWIGKERENSYAWVEHMIEIPSALMVSFMMWSSLSFTSNVEGEMVVGIGGLSSNGIRIYCVNLHTGIWRGIDMVIEGDVQHIYGYFQIDEYVETPLLLPLIHNSS